jgi:hypothetical protein
MFGSVIVGPGGEGGGDWQIRPDLPVVPRASYSAISMDYEVVQVMDSLSIVDLVALFELTYSFNSLKQP